MSVPTLSSAPRPALAPSRCTFHWRAPVPLRAAASARDALPVVLVHGFGMSGRYLRPTAERLAATRPAWVPDLPGHGRAGTPRSPLDVPALAEALVRWMDDVGLARAALLGNSMGAQIVVEAAVRHPERAAALILVGPTFDPARPGIPSLLAALLRDVVHERPALVPIVARDYLRVGPRRLWREFQAMRAHPMAARIVEVRAPVLVVRGAHDPLVSPAWGAELARCAAGRLVTVPGQGHAVNFGGAGALAAIVEELLAGVGR